jgi:hypothetical protein
MLPNYMLCMLLNYMLCMLLYYMLCICSTSRGIYSIIISTSSPGHGGAPAPQSARQGQVEQVLPGEPRLHLHGPAGIPRQVRDRYTYTHIYAWHIHTHLKYIYTCNIHVIYTLYTHVIYTTYTCNIYIYTYTYTQCNTIYTVIYIHM